MVSSFTQRLCQVVRSHSDEVIFVAPSSAGVPYILQALRETETLCVWFKLEPEDAGDPVAQGNRLSDAVTKAFGSQLFGHAMSYQYGLSIIKENLALFEPISFLMLGADHGQEFATELLSLQTPGSKVVIAFEDLPDSFLIGDKALVLQEADLNLSLEEAKLMAQDRLNEVEVTNLLTMAEQKLEPFMVQLHKKLNLPPPLRPGPDGAEAIPGQGLSLPPAVHLQMLIRRDQYIEAFEVAATHLPEKVPEFLELAGNAYMNRGLYRRFYDLLLRLPEVLQETEEVLTWLVRAAKRFGESVKLRERVKSYLDTHEAPDLRAQYATNLATYEEGFAQAERAYRAKKTFLTMLHYAVSLHHKDARKSLEISEELLDFCRTHGDEWQRVQALGSSEPALLQLGQYTRASYVLEETLKAFDNYGSGDWQYRMHTLNNWAFTRIMIGETIGLGEILRKEEKALRDVYPALAFVFRSTLGDYFLSQKDPNRALAYYQHNYDVLASVSAVHAKDFPPHVVRDLVQCLLHLGDSEKAATVARKHYFVSKESDYIETFNTLAYGMVLVMEQPEEALNLLGQAAGRFEQPLVAPYLASTCIYMAKAYLLLGKREAAAKVLERGQIGLAEISETGFRLLSGPEEQFRDVFDLWFKRETPPLVLQFLGDPKVYIHNEAVQLYPKWQDVLALLALNPKGLNPEQLEIELEPDGGELNRLKAMVSKIRGVVPISRSPYRIDMPLQADFIELEQALREGKLRVALELYKGSLLARSEAPGIVEARESLDEMLRQAVLESGDSEALLSLSEAFKDDLELWEAALAALPATDPRRSVALVKHKRVAELWGV
ncbi:MAG: hypothetical protein KC422_24045 [Trueperaceae bacterium]|nr:hypothetical protein [Trueperaceae bacterium]